MGVGNDQAEDALAFAYRMAVNEVAEAEPDAGTKASLQRLIEQAPVELPAWKHPRE